MSKIYLLSSEKYEGVENIPILKIEYLAQNIDLSKYNALLFTSKNAIYSIDSFNKKWKELPSFVIAKKTANIAIKLGGNVEFIGTSGHGNSFAKEVVPLLKNKKVLYLKATKVVSNLIDILKNEDINLDDIAVYKTVFNDSLKIEKLENNSTIIFTSPSTVNYFFENFKWHSSYKAVAIGHTTAKYLPKYINFKVAKTTSIKECIKEAKLLTNNK